MAGSKIPLTPFSKGGIKIKGEAVRTLNLSDNLINQIVQKILEEVKPEKIVIFGSQARSDNAKSSDIDIALFGTDENMLFKVKEKLNEELDTLRDIDLVLYESVKNEKLKKRIAEEGVVIYERGSAG